MDIRKVKKLIELMEESDITEIEIKEGEDAVRISRASRSPSVVEKAMPTETKSPNSVDTETEKEPTGYVVSAPMVGTYYQSPSPGAAPFVEIGTTVNVGDILCIIESMKMMNQIKADRAGKIESVLLQNEAVVEFGQAIFTIS